MKALITVKHLVKNYVSGRVVTKVLKDLNFEVKEGEFLTIMGPSGSGKSTLLYQLGLLDRPTSGKVLYESMDVTTLGTKERTMIRLKHLGYVFQDYALLPDLTAVENTMVPNIRRGLSKSHARELAIETLKRLGMGHRINNLPSQLSGGEQQRVSIARAIAHEPTIVFADEPTANLDTENSEQVLNVFYEIHKAGQTIVMVNHEPESKKYADRIIHLRDGVIETIEKGHKH